MSSMGFYDLAALGSLLWILVFWTALVYSGRFLGAVRPASWPPIITWMWRFAWMLWLLAAITFVVLRIRYPVGGDITISPHVPLMEHVLQVLALVAVYETRVRSRGHERNAAAMWQQLWQPSGHVAWDIVLLIMILVMAAGIAFLIIVVVMVINFFIPL